MTALWMKVEAAERARAAEKKEVQPQSVSAPVSAEGRSDTPEATEQAVPAEASPSVPNSAADGLH